MSQPYKTREGVRKVLAHLAVHLNNWGSGWYLQCPQEGDPFLRVMYMPTSWCWDVRLRHTPMKEDIAASEAFLLFRRLRENAFLIHNGMRSINFGQYFCEPEALPQGDYLYMIVNVAEVHVSERLVRLPRDTSEGDIELAAKQHGVEIAARFIGVNTDVVWPAREADAALVAKFAKDHRTFKEGEGAQLPTTEPDQVP